MATAGQSNIVQRSVERTFAWLGRCRRLAKDFENLAVNALAFLCLGMIRLMLRRLARASAA
jgi:transposase